MRWAAEGLPENAAILRIRYDGTGNGEGGKIW